MTQQSDATDEIDEQERHLNQNGLKEKEHTHKTSTHIQQTHTVHTV